MEVTEETNSNHICILKTGRLLDHDLTANTLTENGIPFYKQMETIAGLKLAMPFQPANKRVRSTFDLLCFSILSIQLVMLSR